MRSLKPVVLSAAFAASALSAAAPAMAEEYTLIAAPIPPYGIVEDGVMTGGVLYDTLQEITSRVGHPFEVEVMPWARAYNTMQQEDDHIIVMMVRSPPREDLFHWVLPVLPERMVIWTWNGDALSVDDAADVGRVGVQLDTPMHNWAEAQGWTNLEVASDPYTLARLLAAGRVDAMVNLESLAIFSAVQEGLDPSQLVGGDEVFSSHVYITGSRNLVDADFSAWEAAFAEMQADGTYAEILSRYGLEPAMN